MKKFVKVLAGVHIAASAIALLVGLVMFVAGAQKYAKWGDVEFNDSPAGIEKLAGATQKFTGEITIAGALATALIAGRSGW